MGGRIGGMLMTHINRKHHAELVAAVSATIITVLILISQTL